MTSGTYTPIRGYQVTSLCTIFLSKRSKIDPSHSVVIFQWHQANVVDMLAFVFLYQLIQTYFNTILLRTYCSQSPSEGVGMETQDY